MNKAKITERLQETPPQELKPKRQGDLFPVAESEGTAHHPCPEAVENVTMDSTKGLLSQNHEKETTASHFL